MLLVAAGLKSYSLVLEPVAGLLWQALALVALEVFCGLALVLGLWLRQLRWATLALFAAFLSFSLSRAFSGAASCGCLGKIGLSPWAAVVLDIAAILALWFSRPNPEPEVQPLLARRARYRLRMSLAISLPLILVAGLTWAGSSEPFPRLQVNPGIIDLGTVPQGSRSEVTFLLRNPHDVPVPIHSFEISCHCLKLNRPGLVLAPGKEEKLGMLLDVRKEWRFTGSLLVTIRGRAATGQISFIAQVQLTIELKHD